MPRAARQAGRCGEMITLADRVGWYVQVRVAEWQTR